MWDKILRFCSSAALCVGLVGILACIIMNAITCWPLHDLGTNLMYLLGMLFAWAIMVAMGYMVMFEMGD